MIWVFVQIVDTFSEIIIEKEGEANDGEYHDELESVEYASFQNTRRSIHVKPLSYGMKVDVRDALTKAVNKGYESGGKVDIHDALTGACGQRKSGRMQLA
jgi:hypothetical protein